MNICCIVCQKSISPSSSTRTLNFLWGNMPPSHSDMFFRCHWFLLSLGREERDGKEVRSKATGTTPVRILLPALHQTCSHQDHHPPPLCWMQWSILSFTLFVPWAVLDWADHFLLLKHFLYLAPRTPYSPSLSPSPHANTHTHTHPPHFFSVFLDGFSSCPQPLKLKHPKAWYLKPLSIYTHSLGDLILSHCI